MRAGKLLRASKMYSEQRTEVCLSVSPLHIPLWALQRSRDRVRGGGQKSSELVSCLLLADTDLVLDLCSCRPHGLWQWRISSLGLSYYN